MSSQAINSVGMGRMWLLNLLGRSDCPRCSSSSFEFILDEESMLEGLYHVQCQECSKGYLYASLR